jgi:hypothetical protein
MGAGFGSYYSNLFKDDHTSEASCAGKIDDEPSCQWAYYLVIEDASFFKIFCTWILIFTNFVPISLTVSLELVKFW